VPVNFHALRRPRRDMVLVAIAGPFTNLTLATLSAAALRLVGVSSRLDMATALLV